MSNDTQNTDNGSNGASAIPTTAPTEPRNESVNPGYQPAFERVELTEVRAPFWGIANHAMHEYYDEQR